jgi:alpha-galactosidase
MAKAKRKVKIVAIGVGSASFGRGVLADVFGSPRMRRLDAHLVLVDINPAALDRMTTLAGIIRAHYGSKVSAERTTDRRAALEGADYVIISVAVRRMELWEQDFRVPLAYGFKHPLGENGGPGAVFHTLRSLELVLPIVQDVERVCPNALVLNYTNPESRVLMGINAMTRARAVGLCHGQMHAREVLAEKILKRPLNTLDTEAGGLNHFFWFTRIADARTGQDLYPLVLRKIARDPTLVPPLVGKMMEVFGCYTYPSDDHIGEYLSFAHEFTGLKWHYGRECKKVVPAEEASASQDWLEPYVTGAKAPDDELVKSSGELAIPIITAIELNKRTHLPAVNLLNTRSCVRELPTDAIVEVPAIADRRGLMPQRIGPLPEALAAYCRTQVSIQKLIVEAFVKRSRNLLLQALLLDPVVNSVANAGKMLDDMLGLQADYLPRFK